MNTQRKSSLKPGKAVVLFAASLVLSCACGSKLADEHVGDKMVDRGRQADDSLGADGSPSSLETLRQVRAAEGLADPAGLYEGDLGSEDVEQTLGSGDSERSDVGVLIFSGAVLKAWMGSFSRAPLLTLRKRLRALGYASVEIVDYRNSLDLHREEMEAQALASMEEHIASAPKDRRFILIGHSYGHYLAMVAATKTRFSDRLVRLIGLAGAAAGADKPVVGCKPLLPFMGSGESPEQRCPGIEGLIQGSASYIADRMIRDFVEQRNAIPTCSIAVQGDRSLSPDDSGFLPGGVHRYVRYTGHLGLPSHKETITQLQDHCDI